MPVNHGRIGFESIEWIVEYEVGVEFRVQFMTTSTRLVPELMNHFISWATHNHPSTQFPGRHPHFLLGNLPCRIWHPFLLNGPVGLAQCVSFNSLYTRPHLHDLANIHLSP
jgi:hypothetical protein